ncbi:apicomplexan-specific protein, partial [Reticulomyxa filosa]
NNNNNNNNNNDNGNNNTNTGSINVNTNANVNDEENPAVPMDDGFVRPKEKKSKGKYDETRLQPMSYSSAISSFAMKHGPNGERQRRIRATTLPSTQQANDAKMEQVRLDDSSNHIHSITVSQQNSLINACAQQSAVVSHDPLSLSLSLSFPVPVLCLLLKKIKTLIHPATIQKLFSSVPSMRVRLRKSRGNGYKFLSLEESHLQEMTTGLPLTTSEVRTTQSAEFGSKGTSRESLKKTPKFSGITTTTLTNATVIGISTQSKCAMDAPCTDANASEMKEVTTPEPCVSSSSSSRRQRASRRRSFATHKVLSEAQQDCKPRVEAAYEAEEIVETDTTALVTKQQGRPRRRVSGKGTSSQEIGSGRGDDTRGRGREGERERESISQGQTPPNGRITKVSIVTTASKNKRGRKVTKRGQKTSEEDDITERVINLAPPTKRRRLSSNASQPITNDQLTKCTLPAKICVRRSTKTGHDTIQSQPIKHSRRHRGRKADNNEIIYAMIALGPLTRRAKKQMLRQATALQKTIPADIQAQCDRHDDDDDDDDVDNDDDDDDVDVDNDVDDVDDDDIDVDDDSDDITTNRSDDGKTNNQKTHKRRASRKRHPTTKSKTTQKQSSSIRGKHTKRSNPNHPASSFPSTGMQDTPNSADNSLSNSLRRSTRLAAQKKKPH